MLLIDLIGKKRCEKPLKFLMVFVSVVSTFFVIEIVLCSFWPQIFLPSPPGLYLTDADIGHIHTPNFRGRLEGAEFQVLVRINQAGLRGKELRPIKKNTFRILCLGDSFTWGYGSNDENTYPAELEKFLQIQYPFLDIQVLNAGVCGYGNNEELKLLRKMGKELRPNLIIIQFFAGNDFVDNVIPANRAIEVRNGMLYAIQEPGKDRNPLWLRIIHRLKQKSHLVHLVSERIGYLAIRTGILAKIEHFSCQEFTEKDSSLAVNLLVEIGEMAQQLGAEKIYLFAPEKVQLLVKLGGPLRASKVVKKSAELTNSPWIDLTSALIQNNGLDKLYFKQDSHWTPEGNKFVAHVVMKKIIELNLIHAINQ